MPALNLKALHEAIQEELLEKVPAVKTVLVDYAFIDFEDWQSKSFPLLTVECNRMTPVNEQGGGEQLRIDLFFQFRLVMIEKGNAPLQARGLALQVAQALHLNRFNQPIHPFKVQEISLDFVNEDKHRKYTVMLIEARTQSLLGQNVWDDPETIDFEGLSSRISINGEGAKTEVLQ
jgi:hypothetical protein